MLNGADFFDNPDVFAIYNSARQRPTNPNDTIEKPIFMQLLGDVKGIDILDLGCGDGLFGVELLGTGCRSYTGIEASQRMIELARDNLRQGNAKVEFARIEDWSYPEAVFDIAISRLALHYIEDVNRVFEQVARALKPNGRLVFSVIHPVITSCNRGATESGVRQDWIVDDYFVPGKRDVAWLGGHVVQYHRTIEDYYTGLQQAGFIIDHLRESRPMPENFSDEALFQRRQRIPLFLLLSAHRS